MFQDRWKGVRSAGQGTNDGNRRSYALVALWGEGNHLTDAAKVGFRHAARLLGQPLDKVHSDWKSTACPGDELRNWVRSGAHAAADVPVVRPDPEEIAFCSHGTFGIEGAALQQPCVRVWQRLVNERAGGLHGQPLQEDGYFGPRTEAATKNVQNWVGQPDTGIVDPATWKLLM